MADLLGADYRLAADDTLYRCLDKLLEHKTALFSHLQQRWKDLFGARFDVLLYDLTSTYIWRVNPLFQKETNDVLATAVISALIACRWSLRWGSLRRAFPWATKCWRETRGTSRRWPGRWPRLKSHRARPVGCG